MTISPTFLLIRPQLGENIGAAARVMHNFGFTDLRIVAPRDGWPNPAAQSMAAGGASVLERAQLFSSTREAIEDLQFIYATTARSREMEKPSISLHDFLTDLAIRRSADRSPRPALSSSHSASSRRAEETTIKTAFLFGPERSGLENEDIALSDSILCVPVNPAYPSLNLAQTVALVAYEVSKISIGGDAVAIPQPSASGSTTPAACALATKADVAGLFDQLEAELDAKNFWKVSEKKEKMWINIRNLFTRAGLSEQEVRTLRGMIRCLSER